MNYTKLLSVSILLLCFLFLSYCSAKKRKMTILIHMTDAQKEFFIKEVVKNFEKENDLKIDVISAPNIDEIEKILLTHPDKISLVKIPFIHSWSLVRKNLIVPLNDFLGNYDLGFFYNDYILTWFGQKDKIQYFLPRKYETRIMVFRKSKVIEAYNSFGKYKDSINSILKQINGYGLPYNYKFDRNPLHWDYYDIFVLGFIWSQLKINGMVMPRVAHRGKKYSGTSLRVIDRIYQCSGDSTAFLGMDGPSVVDAFEWEALYTYANIYNKKMWEEEWSGKNIWEGFASDDVFLSFLTQIDCVYLIGTGKDGIEGYIKDKSDIGMTLMPTGCSVQLDMNGNVLRKGKKSITTGGWWWAIPKSCPDLKLTYRFYGFITSRSVQLEECSRFGMIPVRRDILKNKYIISDNGWISKIFRVSYKQIQINDKNMLPSHINMNRIADIYLNALFDIVVNRNWSSMNSIPVIDTSVNGDSI
ncbi:MAG: ABC transporter substrate-binding protein, partial [Chitinispirillia bacterium]